MTIKCPKCTFAFDPDDQKDNLLLRDVIKAERVRWNKLTPEEQEEERRLEAEAGF
jgi:hypothetical protein